MAGTQKAIPSLDGLRAVAVIAVILGHAKTPGLPVSLPATGVTLFFALSGYLITTLLLTERDRTGTISLRDFYLRRIFRIWPPMYVTLTASLVLMGIGVIDATFNPLGIAAAAFQFVNYQQIFSQPNLLPGGTGVFWSLAVEEHFYLLFPALLSLVLIRRHASRKFFAYVILVLIVGVIAWRTFVMLEVPRLGESRWSLYATDAQADSLLLGALLAVVANPFHAGRSPRHSSAVWPTAALVAGLALLLLPPIAAHSAQPYLGLTAQGLGAVGIIWLVVAFPTSWFGRVLNWRPVSYVGVLSYCMYLVHRLVQIPILGVDTWPRGFDIAVSTGVTIAVAWLLHLIVERPFARLRRRLSHTGLDEGHTGGAQSAPVPTPPFASPQQSRPRPLPTPRSRREPV